MELGFAYQKHWFQSLCYVVRNSLECCYDKKMLFAAINEDFDKTKPTLVASEKAVCEASHVIYHVDLQTKPQDELK